MFNLNNYWNIEKNRNRNKKQVLKVNDNSNYNNEILKTEFYINLFFKCLNLCWIKFLNRI